MPRFSLKFLTNRKKELVVFLPLLSAAFFSGLLDCDFESCNTQCRSIEFLQIVGIKSF